MHYLYNRDRSFRKDESESYYPNLTTQKMLYSILKTIIDTTIVQYNCQNCQWKIDENSVTIGETNENQIHLDIICPHCQSHAHIHAEVANVNTQITHTRLGSGGDQRSLKKNENAIKDTDIQAVTENLQHIRSVEDLLK